MPVGVTRLNQELQRIVVAITWIIPISTSQSTERDFLDHPRGLWLTSLLATGSLLCLFEFQVKPVDMPFFAFYLSLQFHDVAFLRTEFRFENILLLALVGKR